MNAAIYYGAADTILASLTVLDQTRDVTLNLSAGEADVTTRANSGWRATAATLREATVEFEMVWKPGDTGFEAIRDAFLTNGVIELAVLDQLRTVSGAQGPKGNFSITSFSRGEPLEDAIITSVTAKMTSFAEWVEV
jgi:hypothetical protein